MAEGTSVVDLILRDHRRVKRVLSELEAISDDDLSGYLSKLREKLVRYGFAEELIVYPTLREYVNNGSVIADSCIARQVATKCALATLDGAQMPSAKLRVRLEELREAVLAHVDHEHVEVLPALLRGLDESALGALGDRYDRALATGATYYRPKVVPMPTGEAALVATPSSVGRFRDAVHAARIRTTDHRRASVARSHELPEPAPA
jgi:hypothetical protein